MKFVLNEYHRDVPTEELIADVKRVALLLKKDSLTISEYNSHGKYYSSTIMRRMGSWKQVLELAKLSTDNHNFHKQDEEYIADLQRVAKAIGKDTLTSREYATQGKHSRDRISKRFGSWENALKAAGLQPTGFIISVSDAELLNEIEQTWIRLGRQPTTGDIKAGASKYSLNTYSRHFGSWRKALERFIEYINSEEDEAPQPESSHGQETFDTPSTNNHKTQRDINLRMRFLVMKRDNFKCCFCGASPASDSSVMLHIDHIIPWSKGGETTIDNLQTLCSKCNLGKSNIM